MVENGYRFEHGERPFRCGDGRGGESTGEQIRRRQIAAQMIEYVRQAVWPIGDPVFIEVGVPLVRPVIAVESRVRASAHQQRGVKFARNALPSKTLSWLES